MLIDLVRVDQSKQKTLQYHMKCIEKNNASSSFINLHQTIISTEMMPAQLVSVAEAALGPLHLTSQFFERLMKYGTDGNASPLDTALFGDTFINAPKQPWP